MAVPPRYPLALCPTPILKLDRLSRQLGVELYLKRDDLTGLLESGNKVRKLEFLVGEAAAEGAGTLTGCGARQAGGARRQGRKARDLWRQSPPGPAAWHRHPLPVRGRVRAGRRDARTRPR